MLFTFTIETRTYLTDQLKLYDNRNAKLLLESRTISILLTSKLDKFNFYKIHNILLLWQVLF